MRIRIRCLQRVRTRAQRHIPHFHNNFICIFQIVAKRFCARFSHEQLKRRIQSKFPKTAAE